VIEHCFEVIGGIEAGRLRVLVPEVAHLHHPSGRVAQREREPVDGEHGDHARVERSGREDDLVGGGDRGQGVGRGRRVGRHDLDPTDPSGRSGHRDLTFHGAAVDVGLEHDRFGRRGQRTAAGADDPAGLVERAHRVADRLEQCREHEVAQRVAGELAVVEAVLEGSRPHARLVGQRDERLAEVAGREDAEVAAEPPRRAAVVGHGDDRGDVTRVLPDGPQRVRKTVAAADRDDARPAELRHGRDHGGGPGSRSRDRRGPGRARSR
jgi:hypothetical protein